jgi:maltooligosyltrehalose trehalohydrolase
MSMSSSSLEPDEPYPWERPLGARQIDDERAEFRVWAPRVSAPALKVAGTRHAMIDAGLGMWEAIVPAAPGSDYVYVIDGEELPDPASRWQPAGLRGPSRVLDTRRLATERRGGFMAPALDELLIYELHIGTFTPEGTFAGAAARVS